MTGTLKMTGSRDSCTCSKCARACEHNPGWMTPDEALAAVEAGHAVRLMLDWLEPSDEVGNEDRIPILCPASEGYEGEDAPEMPEEDFITLIFSPWFKGRCTFLTPDSKCEIHDSGFKPLECREALSCNPSKEAAMNLHAQVIPRMWDTDEGRRAVSAWRNALTLVEAA